MKDLVRDTRSDFQDSVVSVFVFAWSVVHIQRYMTGSRNQEQAALLLKKLLASWGKPSSLRLLFFEGVTYEAARNPEAVRCRSVRISVDEDSLDLAPLLTRTKAAVLPCMCWTLF